MKYAQRRRNKKIHFVEVRTLLPWHVHFLPIVQNGKFAAWAASEPTRALKRVLFPTFGSPTMPVWSFPIENDRWNAVCAVRVRHVNKSLLPGILGIIRMWCSSGFSRKVTIQQHFRTSNFWWSCWMLTNTRFLSQNSGYLPTSVVKIIAIFWLLHQVLSTLNTTRCALIISLQYCLNEILG